MRLFPSSALPLIVITIDVLSLTRHARGADIILALFMPAPESHARSLSAIARALVLSGHNVTILTSSYAETKGFQTDTYSTAIHYKFIDIPPGYKVNEEEVIKLAFEKSLVNQITALGNDISLMRRGCECLFDDSATLAMLNDSSFDLLIGDSFEGCDAMLSSYLVIPYIAVTTTARYPFFNERLFGIPFPPSYVPFGLFPLSDTMSFPERIASFIEHHVVMSILEWTHFRALTKIKDKHGFAPGRGIQDLIAKAELWLSVTSFALDYPHPTAPNWVAIGNIADIPAKPLEKDYERFVEGSAEHGFIVFSMGSHISEFPKAEMAEAFARVLSELPQRVIWRYTGTSPRYLGNNTMLVDWMPQNDLVGHPKARLLICHGGISGILEAIYHAVPMVIMPVFSEQESNAVKVEDRGMGRRLQKDSIKYETVKAAVTEVLDNPSFKENVRRSSRIYSDIQSKPNETVVFWVEHILKFGGSHLRTRALELNFIQLHSIDVLTFVVGFVLVIVFLLCLCCKRCISWCLKSKKEKQE